MFPIAELHSPTLMYAALAVALPMGALAIATGRALPDLGGPRHWAGAALCVTAAMVLYITAGASPPWSMGADVLAVVGLLLMRQGLAGVTPSSRRRIGVTVACLVGFVVIHTWFGHVDPRPDRRAAVASAAMAVAAVSIVWELFRPVGRPLALVLVAGATFGSMALGLGYRAVEMLLGGPRPVDAMVLGREAALPLLLVIAAQVGGGAAFCGFAGFELIQRLRTTQGLLERAVREDALTGLASRRALFEILRAEISRARSGARALALLVIDADQFKRVNDECGHVVGDAVLAAFGGCLNAHVRGGDHAGRIGGEEFAVVMPGATLAEAASVAERIGGALAQLTVPGLVCPISASLGVAVLRPDDQSDIRLLARADRAMYQAKRAGGNQVAVDES